MNNNNNYNSNNNNYNSNNNNNNIVLDNGSSLLKAGISGTDIAPSIFCPTLIGVLVNQTN